MRVWLHQGHDGDPGMEGIGVDALGFATWAPDEASLLAKLPAAFADHVAWGARHGIEIVAEELVEVMGRFTGGEILFPSDREPALASDIELALRLLEASRAELMTLLEAAPPAALDWDPPYRRFAPWASWRTIRANLAHVANGETHYYTRNIGHAPEVPPAAPDDDWRAFLPRTRDEATRFLRTLPSSGDLLRLHTFDHGLGEEAWSVPKALRRLVAHERLHTKSIARILRDYAALPPGSRRSRSLEADA